MLATARAGLALTALLLGLALFRLDLAPIVTMEGIVGAGARTMLRQGNWAVPELYGEIYSFKPPLAWWLVAGSFRLFGESAFALRLPFALAGAAIAPMVFLICRLHVGNARAFAAGLAAATGLLVFQKLRLAETDVLLAFGAGGAMRAAASALVQGSLSRWSVTYALLVFGVLAKGSPAVLFFVPGLVAASLWLGRARELVRVRHLVPMLLGAGAVVLWVWLAWEQSGGQAFVQPLAEARDRASAWTWGRVGESLLKPLLPVGLFLPWSGFLPSALRQSTKSDFGKALAAFVVLGVVAMMFVPRTSSRYFLPLCVPVGALVGMYWGNARSRWLDVAIDGVVGLVGLAAIAASAGVPGGALPLDVRLVGFLVGVFALFMAWRGLARGDAPSLLSRLACLSVAFWVVLAFGVDLRRARKRSKDLAAIEFAEHLAPDDVLMVEWLDKHSNLFFLLDRPVRRFDLDQELPSAGSWLVLEERQVPRLYELPDRALRRVATSGDGASRLSLWRVIR